MVYLTNTKRTYRKFPLVSDSLDKRDYIVKAKVKEKELPEAVDLRHWDSPIRNQKNIGSCASHSVLAVMENQLNHFKPGWALEQSELFHYYYSRIQNGTYPLDSGMTLRNACKALHKFGSTPERFWKYNTKKFNFEPGLLARMMAKFWRIKGYVRMPNLTTIKAFLEDDHEISTGVWVYKNFMQHEGKDIIELPKSKSPRYGGHGATIAGYDNKDKYFHIKNSWGTRWGDKGYAKLSYDYFKKYNIDSWSILLK